MPSACPAASPSGVLRSVPSMPTSVAPSAEPFAENATRHLPRPSGVCVSEQRAVSQAAHQLHLRVYYGAVEAAVRCAGRRAICGTIHRAVCCVVCVSEQLAVSRPISYACGCATVGAVDAAVGCEHRAICGTIHHAVCCAVCIYEQVAVWRPISYAFWCTRVCAVEAVARLHVVCRPDGQTASRATKVARNMPQGCT
eukprot:CAMPEP_0181202652 /NCGR_PEP_ID=MMETSP1096-20121128/18964_1 /TAXON_ID=156174 ORGANISM="Chrysochromulina ericina, Strain CCMP281" /NCGR_SAMPLE_ID=MMETSP1096 /ASSEMBLY_ACC=CAM_ASM_000453 /LENGTH=196 /DNA_ID=CAMNT_0023293195 /DNA_START=93 /DNA_END=683 /DNA_ORIENTATION=-